MGKFKAKSATFMHNLGPSQGLKIVVLWWA